MGGGQQMCFTVTKSLFAPLTLFTDAGRDSQSIQLPPGQRQKLFPPSQIVTSARWAETTD